jgi:hypothetical protein
VPSFPIAGPSPSPTPLTLAVVTPAPQPPGGEAAPETEFPNLLVKAIEVTQGIQNLANDMPLVQDRRTYARVYVDITGAVSWPNTWGALEARRNGQQIGWIWPENGPITAKAGGGDRTSLDDSLQFRLPASWLSGTVTLTTFVFSYTIFTPFTDEPDAADNTALEVVIFREGLPLTVHLAPLHLHRSYHPSDVERTYGLGGGGLFAPGGATGGTDRVISGLFRYLPLWKVSVDTLNSAVTPLDHGGGHEFDLGGECRSIVLDVLPASDLIIADWTILMKAPAEITPDPNVINVPDRTELRVLDRTFTISAFVAEPDGTGLVYASSDGLGPDPIPGAPAYAYGCAEVTPKMAEPNTTLALYRVFYDWQDEREMFVGMVDPSLRTVFGGFSTDGTDSVWVRMSDTFGASDPWRHSGGATLGHEAAHAAGLKHVPCKDDDGNEIPDELIGGDLDLTHPMTLTFPDCWLSDVDEDGYYGVDVQWDRFGLDAPTVLSNDPAQPLPNVAWPALSYKGPGWSDPYHYCRMLTYYGVPCSPTQLDLPWNPPNPLPDGSDPFAAFTPPPEELEPGVHAALLSLTQDEDGGWTIEMIARNSEPTPDLAERISAQKAVLPDPDGYTVVVRRSEAAIALPAWISGPAKPHDATGGPSIGTLVVPMPPDGTAIEVRGPDGELKAKLDPSPGYPEVAGLFKDTADGETVEPDDEILVTFEAGDPDGDELRFTLLYAPDREHWQVVGETRDSEIRVPVRGLPSGDDPAFRLIAFDGWSVDEEILPAPELDAPRNPPQIWILTQTVASYPMRAPVRLEAAAFDVEDRDLSGDAIRWRSSIDGDLGTGSELVTRALSAGTHVITATATDSDGLDGSTTHELVIDGAVVAPLPDEALQAGMAGIFDRLGAGLDPAPNNGSIVGGDFNFEEEALSVLVLILAGGLGLVIVAFAAGRYFRVGRPTTGAAVGGAQSTSVGATQSISVGAAQDGGSPELLAHEAAHTTQGDAPPADDPSTWMPTDQLGTSGSMDPQPGGGGANELATEDTSGKEN